MTKAAEKKSGRTTADDIFLIGKAWLKKKKVWKQNNQIKGSQDEVRESFGQANGIVYLSRKLMHIFHAESRTARFAVARHTPPRVSRLCETTVCSHTQRLDKHTIRANN